MDHYLSSRLFLFTIALWRKEQFVRRFNAVFRSNKSKNDGQYISQKKRDKRRKISTKHYTENEILSNTYPTPLTTGGMHVLRKGIAVPASLVTSVILLLNDTNIIWHGNRVGHQYRWINTNDINKTWSS